MKNIGAAGNGKSLEYVPNINVAGISKSLEYWCGTKVEYNMHHYEIPQSFVCHQSSFLVEDNKIMISKGSWRVFLTCLLYIPD